jgi:hypothetical protein
MRERMIISLLIMRKLALVGALRGEQRKSEPCHVESVCHLRPHERRICPNYPRSKIGGEYIDIFTGFIPGLQFLQKCFSGRHCGIRDCFSHDSLSLHTLLACGVIIRRRCAAMEIRIHSCYIH